MLLDPARSVDPPIIFEIFETISKNFSEHFLVAIGSNDFKYSDLPFQFWYKLYPLLIYFYLYNFFNDFVFLMP